MKKYYSVMSVIFDDGRTLMKQTDLVEADKIPENTFESKSDRDIYVDWFESWQEASAFIKENEKV